MQLSEFRSSLIQLKTLDEQLDYISQSDYDIVQGGRPESILNSLRYKETKEDAIKIADTFLTRYGNVIICLDWSERNSMPMTIVDLIVECGFDASPCIYEAFVEKGFLPACKCDCRVLYSMYGSYCRDCMIFEMNVWYNYTKLKYVHQQLNEDLQAYLWQPRKIEKWLSQGNELESYLA
jgi:hypothetical protein